MIWMDVDTALSEVPVNIAQLIDDTDFKTIESAVAYNAAGMALKWNFVTTAGAYTQTAVTPTSGGDYDWNSQGNGMYSIEIPASGGASINNDTEGFGWFSGVATGVLPWIGPVIGFRAAGLNDKLIDSAYDTPRGLSGTALPNAAAEASGGLPTLSAAQASNGTIQANVHRWLTGTPNALQSGRVDSYLGAVAAGVIAAASFAANALDAVWSTATRTLTAFGFSVTVGTNNDKTGYSLGTGGLSSASVSAAAAEKIADALLDRNQSGGSNTGFTVSQSLKVVRNKVVVVDLGGGVGEATVYEEDGSTPAFTFDVTLTPSDPLSSVTPS